MQMWHKLGLRYPLIVGLSALVLGCASQKPSVDDTAVNQSLKAQIVSTSKNTSDGGQTETLSATTVAPVGFEKFMGIFTPYRMTIQQGNFVSEEMASQLKEGMTREQVRFILGTSLLTDMFHADRWDYIFRLLKPNGELTTSRVTVYFHQSLVSKIERGNLPDEKEYLARIINARITDGEDDE